MDYATRMASIEAADKARRMAREADEMRKLGLTVETDYCHSRNLTGEPTEKNRVYRASDDSWKRGLKGRTFGIARKGAPAHTMLVTKDGKSSVVSTRQRGVNIHKRQAQYRATRITAANLAPSNGGNASL